MSTSEEGLYSPTPEYTPDRAVDHLFKQAYRIAEDLQPVPEAMAHPWFYPKVKLLHQTVTDLNMRDELGSWAMRPETPELHTEQGRKVQLYLSDDDRLRFSLLLVTWNSLGQSMYAESLDVFPPNTSFAEAISFERGNIGDEMTLLSSGHRPIDIIATHAQLALIANERDK
jgi:hypothetical protein